LSVKWRRSKKRSGWFNILRASNRVKDRNTPRTFRFKNPRVKRQTCPYRYRASKMHIERKWREPRPLIDILEEKNEIIVIAQFAGFKRENLKINVKNQRLTLSAETLDRKYYKSLNLPKRVIPNTMRTTYKNGVLEIRLEKGVEEKAIDQVAG
jgi:HSP20 family molecular chaperone IbpA